MNPIFLESSLTIANLKTGWIFDENAEEFKCIFCSQCFRQGIIYKNKSNFVDAKRAVIDHIKEAHGSSFDVLVNLCKKDNGLSDIQKLIMTGMYRGLSDDKIARMASSPRALSTIRNHRFTLREKYREARIFTALMEIIEESAAKNPEENFVDYHNALPVSDERAVITENEREKLINKHMDTKNRILKKFPKKQKEKLVLLREIALWLEKERIYTERELNEVLKSIYFDYAEIRRYLIEYRFMERKADGSEYRVII